MITFKTYLEEMVGRYSPLRQARLKKEKEDRAKKAAPKRNPGTGMRKEEVELDEEAPATNTAGVDMNPTGKPKKQDKRSRFDIDKMFRRANGV